MLFVVIHVLLRSDRAAPIREDTASSRPITSDITPNILGRSSIVKTSVKPSKQLQLGSPASTSLSCKAIQTNKASNRKRPQRNKVASRARGDFGEAERSW